MFVSFVNGLNTSLPVGPAGGDLSGTYPNPNARGFHETTGPTQLLYGSVPDTTFLRRSGLTVVGVDPNTVVRGPFASVLYVDNVRGSDTTGTRGNNNLPFATVQAALNAMQTDDVVQLAPQKFTQAQLTVPATVVRGACVGYKPPGILNSSLWPGTIITSTGANGWEFGATLGIARFYLCDIMHQSGIISADGSVAPYAKDAFFASGLWIRNCTGFVTAKYASQVVIQGPGGNGNYITTGCGVVQFYGIHSPGGNCTITWDAGDPLTTTANSGTQFLGGSQMGVITMTTQAHVTCDETSRIGTLTGSGLTVSGANVPLVSCCGWCTDVNFATAGAELPDTATAITMDFRGTRFFYNFTSSVGAATSIKFKVAGAAANAQTVKLDNTSTLGGCTITADANIAITGRGASWPAVVLTTPGATGSITPPMLTGTIDISAGGTVAKTWVQLGYAGLVRTTAPDTAFVTSIAAACDAVISVKATTGLTFISAAVGGNTAANWQAVWK